MAPRRARWPPPPPRKHTGGGRPPPRSHAGHSGGGGSPQDKLHKEGGWYEPKYGEGAQCHYCHVIIPKSHYAALPPKRPDEEEQLRTYPFPEDMTHT